MTLAYTRTGTGPTLVLLHGLSHRRQAWDPVIGRLAAHRDVIAADLPGHGGSPPLELAGRSVTDALADELTHLMDELGLEQPHVAGNSLGGRIALEAAARGQVASVTALSPAGFWRNGAELAYIKGVFAAMTLLGERLAPVAGTMSRSVAGRNLMYAAIVARPGKMTPEQALGDMDAFLAARPAMRAILAEALAFTAKVPGEVPVTVGWGSKDRLTWPGQARVAKELLPDARFVKLTGCGHVPMNDDPAAVAKVLLRGSAG